MTYVITDRCEGCKDTSCVTVCPADAIHPTSDEAEFSAAEQLYIDPELCIHCGLCVDECPVKAIFAEEDLPHEMNHFTQINADWFTRKVAK